MCIFLMPSTSVYKVYLFIITLSCQALYTTEALLQCQIFIVTTECHGTQDYSAQTTINRCFANNVTGPKAIISSTASDNIDLERNCSVIIFFNSWNISHDQKEALDFLCLPASEALIKKARLEDLHLSKTCYDLLTNLTFSRKKANNDMIESKQNVKCVVDYNYQCNDRKVKKLFQRRKHFFLSCDQHDDVKLKARFCKGNLKILCLSRALQSLRQSSKVNILLRERREQETAISDQVSPLHRNQRGASTAAMDSKSNSDNDVYTLRERKFQEFNLTAYKLLEKEELMRKLSRESEWAYLCLVFIILLILFSIYIMRGFHSRTAKKREIRHDDDKHYLTVKEVLYRRAQYLPMFNRDDGCEEVFVHDCGTNT